MLRVLTHVGSCADALTAADLTLQSEVAVIETESLSGIEVIAFVDPVPSVCVEECETNINGRWFWRDSGHLSLEGAELARPQIVSIFDMAGP